MKKPNSVTNPMSLFRRTSWAQDLMPDQIGKYADRHPYCLPTIQIERILANQGFEMEICDSFR